MKILLINEVCGYTSTGKICGEIADELAGQGHEVKIAYGRSSYVPDKYQKYGIRIGNDWTVRLHALKTRLFDAHGFGSKGATRKFLEWADSYDPDLIWLHNLHGYYINIELLFRWIKSHPEKEVKWTLHDCWAFTGHCVHFTMAKCDKWKTGCQNCPQKNEYPASRWIDRSERNYQEKKQLFCGIKNMQIITPSQWLAELVRTSYLGGYPVRIRYNTVDTTIFKPTPSNFREKNYLQNRKIILGVASIWSEKKGLYDFIQLARMLDDTYAIVLVGISERQLREILKRTKKIKLPVYEKGYKFSGDRVRTAKGEAVPRDTRELYTAITKCSYLGKEPSNHAKMLCFPKTNNAKELAEIYTAADFFVNPTYEDNYPTVNLEAIACGTYVITYLTGGSPETLNVHAQ